MLDETFPDSRVFHGHVREWKGGPGAQGLSQRYAKRIDQERRRQPQVKDSMTMEYRDPGTGGRGELLAAIDKNEARELCEAMIAAALNVDDWEWLQNQFVELLHHPDLNVRAIAATSLGHVARVHGHLDVERVRPLLEALRQHHKTRGFADTALEDIEMFAHRP